MQTNTHKIIARYLMAIGLIGFSGALVYFSYAIIYTVNRVPEIVVEIDKASERIDRVLDEVAIVSEQIPPIVNQVDLLQQKIPLILTEVKATRLLIPDMLKEVEQVRLQVPLLLAEAKAAREELPAILNELAGYRKLMPEILLEVEAVRKSIPEILDEVEAVRNLVPPTLDRVEVLTKEARSAGQKASEGAILGFFSGIIKLPYNMFKGVRNQFTSIEMTDEDTIQIRASAIAVIQSKIGSSQKWNNPESGHSGDITVMSEKIVDGTRCRVLRITAGKHKKKAESQEVEACLQDDGEWELSI